MAFLFDGKDTELIFHHNDPSFAIIGGNPATPEDWPFMVALNIQTQNAIYFCSATLIKDNWMLTSGQCIKEYTTDVYGKAGVYNLYQKGLAIETSAIIIHPKYRITSKGYIKNNLALIKLKSPLKPSSTISIVEIASEPIRIGSKCKTAGWNSASMGDEGDFIRPFSLHHIDQPVISLTQCRKILNEKLVQDSNICTLRKKKYKQICFSNFGSPLICNGLLYGINSKVYSCDQNKFPNVWTRIEYYIDWIHQTIEEYEVVPDTRMKKTSRREEDKQWYSKEKEEDTSKRKIASSENFQANKKETNSVFRYPKAYGVPPKGKMDFAVNLERQDEQVDEVVEEIEEEEEEPNKPDFLRPLTDEEEKYWKEVYRRAFGSSGCAFVIPKLFLSLFCFIFHIVVVRCKYK